MSTLGAVKIFPASDALPERTTSAYRARLLKLDRTPMPPEAVTSIELTLVSLPGLEVINGRSAVEVLGSLATIDANGYLTLTLTSDDLQMIGDQKLQPRRMLIDVSYTDGLLPHVVEFYVRNLPGVG